MMEKDRNENEVFEGFEDSLTGEAAELMRRCRRRPISLTKLIVLLLIKILKLLKSRKFGLKEIKRQLSTIIGILLDPGFGLPEIKQEIRDIEERLDQLVPANAITTGPAVADVTAGSLVIKVLNNTGEQQTVTVNVYDVTVCPKVVAFTTDLTIPASCAEDLITAVPLQFELEILNWVPGVYAWAATRAQAVPVPLNASGFIAANTFRHAEFVGQFDGNDNG